MPPPVIAMVMRIVSSNIHVVTLCGFEAALQHVSMASWQLSLPLISSRQVGQVWLVGVGLVWLVGQVGLVGLIKLVGQVWLVGRVGQVGQVELVGQVGQIRQVWLVRLFSIVRVRFSVGQVRVLIWM